MIGFESDREPMPEKNRISQLDWFRIGPELQSSLTKTHLKCSYSSDPPIVSANCSCKKAGMLCSVFCACKIMDYYRAQTHGGDDDDDHGGDDENDDDN